MCFYFNFSGAAQFNDDGEWQSCTLSHSLSPSFPPPVTALLRKLKQQSRETVEDKRPKLLTALKEVQLTLTLTHTHTQALSFCLEVCVLHCHGDSASECKRSIMGENYNETETTLRRAIC